MYPTVTVEHLASVTTADDSDDMKIYEFDREASTDWRVALGWTMSPPSNPYVTLDDVLAA